MCCACGGGEGGNSTAPTPTSPTPAPTPSPNPATCADTSEEATGTNGGGCEWWTDYAQYCAYDYLYDDSDFTAGDMCCACGGGEGGNSTAPTPTSPTPAPTSSPSPAICADTSEEAVGINGGGCEWWTDYPLFCIYSPFYDDADFTAAEMCCACGGGEATATCADTSEEAIGTNGGGCEWWTDYAQYCAYDYLYDDSDFTAGDMCCACGGGEGGDSTAPTPSSPTPAPMSSPNPATCADTSEEAIGTNGGGCEWWTDYAQYCAYDYLYDDSDFTAGDMCCACGGGEGGDSTAPTPSSPTPAPTSSPNPATCADTSEEAIGTNGGGCEWWTDYAQYCAYDFLYDDSDFTAGDMCCACGGGEGGDSTAPTPSSPTPAPTSSPNPATCADTSEEAIGTNGGGCEWWTDYAQYCAYDFLYDDSDFTAGDMCCACGGGEGGDSTAPTPSSPTPAPTSSPNPATCADTSEEAIGTNGGGCEWWTDYAQYCAYDFLYDDSDFTAGDMCCACGGGEGGDSTAPTPSSPTPAPTSSPNPAPTPSSPTPAPTPSPNPATCADTSEEAIGTNGGGCEWWTDYAQYCAYDFLYDDSDFTAGDMCCACGGGEGGDSTAPTPSSPTPAPTSSPNPATCADTSEEAIGTNGGGCEWWTDYAQYCAYDYLYDDSDFTAGDMCCACGGGEGGDSTAPTPSSPTPAPTPSPNPATCADTSEEAIGTNGGGCEWWTDYAQYCAYDYLYDDSDFTAGDMCCACGGGEGGDSTAPTPSSPTPAPTSSPNPATCADTSEEAIGTNGGGCEWWTDYAQYCAYDYLYDDSDFTAGDMCCACGGGEGGDSTAACEDSSEVAFATNLGGCRWWAFYDEYCKYSSSYDDTDFTAAEMCCACGGSGSTATVVVTAEYTSDETLPAGVTSTELMSSTVYKAAKTTGLANALSVPESDITITDFILNARRLSEVVRQLSDTVAISVTTRFSILVADESDASSLATTIQGAAEDIKTHTENAMQQADWSGESVITAAPTMTTPDVSTPNVFVGPTPLPTGSPTPAPPTRSPTPAPTAAPTPTPTSDGICRWTTYGEFWFNSKLAKEYGEVPAFITGAFDDAMAARVGGAVTCDQQSKALEWNYQPSESLSMGTIECPSDVDSVPCVNDTTTTIEIEISSACPVDHHAISCGIAMLAVLLS
ncbi:unnamed protein product [Prorocentrum cordatum]|uniref:Uncharacterized protein n=1 Tax=Prorocentrum cordatum TaxID=2364126 RepID=A0ABN9VG88_9DINO|nr:unnamed protein product [Polarella glacialis]